MKNKDFTVIKCPKCGCEYLPAEIFFPDTLLGKPRDVIRDDNGTIEYYGGDSLNLKEEFECEQCGIHFNVSAKIEFTCTYDEKIDFDEDFVTTVYKNRVILEEPN